MRTESISQSAATNGSFPAILGSQYYPLLYDSENKYFASSGSGPIKSNRITLPEILSEKEYSTGAFIASNPQLIKWSNFFDYFWNDGLSSSESDYIYFDHYIFRKAQKWINYMLLQPRVSATEVAARAKEWYKNKNKPRFLFMHVMEPHGPFPGLKKGLDLGLWRAYKSLRKYLKKRKDSPDEVLKTIRELYWKSIEKIDEQIKDLLKFVENDATIIITADHGEEFYHGIYGHARLYDECVRVPFFLRWTLDNSLKSSRERLRHIDIAPTLLRALGIDAPEYWEGLPLQDIDTFQPTFLINHAPQLERVYVGIRTRQYKYIKTYTDKTGKLIKTEFYDIQNDEKEKINLFPEGPDKKSKYETSLNQFLNRIKSTDERKQIEKKIKKLKDKNVI
ncbi:hypothetical protein AKJ65_01985 [candidate division MSBL1 archaeon SCGC-AAA259E19]|uniref:Sulfatase N-terminal domain-containing protein n=1 Tax=candidate division MSBL1 archaeon SCGC-AAA259E19 TaxID=1698264 RepID=A0A133UMB8_9EURY|nr:hypothetical protein AKJ65_01985 [candidate division MSBL1 archaeon SCGC-AAA259E19]